MSTSTTQTQSTWLVELVTGEARVYLEQFTRQRGEELKAALLERIWRLFGHRLTEDEIEDERLTLDGLTFTVILSDPAMQSQLAYITSCGACRAEMLVPFAERIELGRALLAEQSGNLICPVCYEAKIAAGQIESELPPEPPKTTAEELAEVLHAFVIETMLETPRERRRR